MYHTRDYFHCTSMKGVEGQGEVKVEGEGEGDVEVEGEGEGDGAYTAVLKQREESLLYR